MQLSSDTKCSFVAATENAFDKFIEVRLCGNDRTHHGGAIGQLRVSVCAKGVDVSGRIRGGLLLAATPQNLRRKLAIQRYGYMEARAQRGREEAIF